MQKVITGKPSYLILIQKMQYPGFRVIRRQQWSDGTQTVVLEKRG